MNDILARVAGLLQNPKALTDPQSLARVAGLPPGLFSEDKLRLLSGIGNAVSGVLKGITAPPARRYSPVSTAQPSPVSLRPAIGSNGSKGTPIAGTVSLAAITGAVVVVGTVSAVALAKGRKTRQT